MKADSEQKKNGLPIPKGRLVMGPYKPICRGRDCANLLDQITVGTQSCSWNKLCCSGEHACKNQAHDWVICNSCTSKNPFKHIIILPWNTWVFTMNIPLITANEASWIASPHKFGTICVCSISLCIQLEVFIPSIVSKHIIRRTPPLRMQWHQNHLWLEAMRKFWVEVGSVLMFFCYENMENIEGKCALDLRYFSQVLIGRMLTTTQSIYQHIPTIDMQQKALYLLSAQRKPVALRRVYVSICYFSRFQRDPWLSMLLTCSYFRVDDLDMLTRLEQLKNYSPKNASTCGALNWWWIPMGSNPQQKSTVLKIQIQG